MQKILIKANNWLGDAVMSLPSIIGLKKMFKETDLSVLTRQNLSELYKALPEINNIICYSNWFDAVKKIKGIKFDACLMFPRSFSCAFMTIFAKIPKRVGYADDNRSFLLTDPVPRTEDFLKTHRVYYYYNLLRAFGRPPLITIPELRIPEEYEKKADEIKASLKGKGPVIGFNPGATYGKAKMWFKERFGLLGRRLVKDLDANIFIFGTQREIPICKNVKEKIGKGACDLAGKTSILGLAALIKRCQLFVSNDTGSMHLADAVGTKVVALFGSTNPVVTRPFKRGHVVIYHKFDCSPCLRRRCPHKNLPCMDSISVNEVYEACLGLLAN